MWYCQIQPLECDCSGIPGYHFIDASESEASAVFLEDVEKTGLTSVVKGASNGWVPRSQ